MAQADSRKGWVQRSDVFFRELLEKVNYDGRIRTVLHSLKGHLFPFSFSETVLQDVVLEREVVDGEGKDTGPVMIHEEWSYVVCRK